MRREKKKKLGRLSVSVTAVTNRNAPANDLTPEQRGELPSWDPASSVPKKRRRWTWALGGLVLGIGLGFGVLPGLMAQLMPPPAAPGAETPVEPETVAEAPPAPTILNPVEVATIAPQELRSLIRITGTIRPDRETRLSAKVAGTIETINVNDGETVAEGDVLIEFDTDELRDRLEDQQASLANARIQLETAQATLERTQTLVARNVATQATLDTAQAQVSQAQASVTTLDAQVRAAERSLDYATVRAPFAGVVSTREVSEGESVSIGSPLLTIVDLSNVEVEVMVPTLAIASVQPGQPATITVNGITGRTFAAEVERISPTAPSGAHSIPVYLTLENGDGALRGGMFATGTIEVETRANAIALPPAAVRTDPEGQYVLKVVGGELVRQPVTVGATWNEGALVEVTEGISVGDTVVIAPLPSLEAGVPVSIEGA
jgi:RND family efflux transporter MFP subunit